MFKLAHLSDVHLAPVPPAPLAALGLKRGLGLVNWHGKRKRLHRRDVLDTMMADLAQQRPDHIAVGGDLVNVGLPAEIEAAAIWLRGIGPPTSVTVVPGNHDLYGHRGGSRGLDPWQPYMTGDGGSIQGLPDRAFPFVRRFGRIALVGLSSAIPTPLFWAHGRLGADQRRLLTQALQALGELGDCRIVLIHHPPLPGQADRRRGLEDASELARILRQFGAELVLHGHNHTATVNWLDTMTRPIPVVGVPSTSAAPTSHSAPARYNLFEIEPGAAGWRIGLTGREYSAGGGVVDVDRTFLTG